MNFQGGSAFRRFGWPAAAAMAAALADFMVGTHALTNNASWMSTWGRAHAPFDTWSKGAEETLLNVLATHEGRLGYLPPVFSGAFFSYLPAMFWALEAAFVAWGLAWLAREGLRSLQGRQMAARGELLLIEHRLREGRLDFKKLDAGRAMKFLERQRLQVQSETAERMVRSPEDWRGLMALRKGMMELIPYFPLDAPLLRSLGEITLCIEANRSQGMDPEAQAWGENLLRESLRLSPTDTLTRRASLAWGLIPQDSPEAFVRESMEMAPGDPFFECWAIYFRGMQDPPGEGLKSVEALEKKFSYSPQAQGMRIDLLARLGELEKLQALFDSLPALRTLGLPQLRRLRKAVESIPDPASARRCSEEIEGRSAVLPDPHTWLASLPQLQNADSGSAPSQTWAWAAACAVLLAAFGWIQLEESEHPAFICGDWTCTGMANSEGVVFNSRCLPGNYASYINEEANDFGLQSAWIWNGIFDVNADHTATYATGFFEKYLWEWRRGRLVFENKKGNVLDGIIQDDRLWLLYPNRCFSMVFEHKDLEYKPVDCIPIELYLNTSEAWNDRGVFIMRSSHSGYLESKGGPNRVAAWNHPDFRAKFSKVPSGAPPLQCPQCPIPSGAASLVELRSGPPREPVVRRCPYCRVGGTY